MATAALRCVLLLVAPALLAAGAGDDATCAAVGTCGAAAEGDEIAALQSGAKTISLHQNALLDSLGGLQNARFAEMLAAAHGLNPSLLGHRGEMSEESSADASDCNVFRVSQSCEVETAKAFANPASRSSPSSLKACFSKITPKSPAPTSGPERVQWYSNQVTQYCKEPACAEARTTFIKYAPQCMKEAYQACGCALQ